MTETILNHLPVLRLEADIIYLFCLGIPCTARLCPSDGQSGSDPLGRIPAIRTTDCWQLIRYGFPNERIIASLIEEPTSSDKSAFRPQPTVCLPKTKLSSLTRPKLSRIIPLSLRSAHLTLANPPVFSAFIPIFWSLRGRFSQSSCHRRAWGRHSPRWPDPERHGRPPALASGPRVLCRARLWPLSLRVAPCPSRSRSRR
jgi:hypothetical protein